MEGYSGEATPPHQPRHGRGLSGTEPCVADANGQDQQSEQLANEELWQVRLKSGPDTAAAHPSSTEGDAHAAYGRRNRRQQRPRERPRMRIDTPRRLSAQQQPSARGINTTGMTASKTRAPGSSTTRMVEPAMTPGTVPTRRMAVRRPPVWC
jgi:hypothetical protein